MIFETFRQAIQNVWSNKLRTFLTMLGIIIGVMAVIVIVGLGNGMTKSMRDSFSALGTNTLSVQVDLPEPDWPTMATNSPFSIFMVMWSAAFTVVSPIW